MRSFLLLTGILIMAAGCAPEKVFPEINWQTALPGSRGIHQEKFQQAITWLRKKLAHDRDGITQLLIVKDGYVVHAGDSVHKVHNAFSCTKSFTGIALGLLMDQGKCSDTTLVHTILPELKELYPDVTLAHLVSLTSGYQSARRDKKDETLDRFAPGTPVFLPGKYLQYGPDGFNTLALALTRLAGKPLAELIRERIADRIGMDTGKWHWGSWGEIDGKYNDVNGGAGDQKVSIHTCAYEMAKVGWLLTNRGVWNGDTLLKPVYVEKMTTPRVSADIPPFEEQAWYNILPGTYGYGCWTNGVQRLDNTRMWPSAPEKTAAIQGNKNNYCFIVPEWDMVVCRMGEHRITDGVWDGFFERLGKAIKD